MSLHRYNAHQRPDVLGIVDHYRKCAERADDYRRMGFRQFWRGKDKQADECWQLEAEYRRDMLDLLREMNEDMMRQAIFGTDEESEQ